MGCFTAEIGALQRGSDHARRGIWFSISRRSHSLHAAQIHPYASLAWSVISAANKVCRFIFAPLLVSSCCPIQVLINQKNRDDRIVRLSGTMSDTFSFVDDIKFMKEIGKHVETMMQLLQQATECGYFIAQYAKDSFCPWRLALQ